MSLASLLLEHPFPDEELLLHSVTVSMSAGDARAEARAVAEQLRAAGVQRGQAVAVQLPNDPHTIATMFGVWIAGAVFVPINSRFPAAEVSRILETVRPAMWLRDAAATRLPDPMPYDEDVALVAWTSGTTGAPKPVAHAHSSYVELLDRVLTPLRGAGRDVARRGVPNLVPVPLAVNAGIYNVLFGLRAGAAIVVMDGFDTRVFAELVKRFEIRSTVLPPAAMTMLADDDGVTDLSPLRFVRSITAPLSALQAVRFTEKFGIVVLNGYGQVELGEVIGWTAADAREHPEKLGAVGRPHPGVALKLVDVEHDIGRLFVRPPSTATALDPMRVDHDGYVDTGDLARIDADGFVWIEGRAGDVINRGGNKVFPEQVEEVLRLAPGISDAAVVGMPDARLGEVPVAFVVTNHDTSDDELRRLCRAHLAPYKTPVAFHRVDVLPRSEVGKVLRRALRSTLAAADTPDSPDT
jgi:long-chain acyl-CoA synthetase